MKKYILLFAALTICFTGFSQKISKIDTDLQSEMQLRSQNELIKINIIMKAQYDQMELRSKANIYHLKDEKCTFVLNDLKRHSKETQKGVMDYLDNSAKNKSVKGITSYWIYNGITCYATPKVIEELSFLDDVLIIGYDKLENLLNEKADYHIADATMAVANNITKINANVAWELGHTGRDVIIGVFDTGINYDHDDLKCNMWQSSNPNIPYHGWNFVDNNNNPMDYHGHGTHCAGTVAGDGASGTQTGVAPNATIMALQVLNSSGDGQPSDLVSAMEFAIEHGVHIFSISLGWANPTASTRLLLRNAMVNVLEVGIIAAVAAGNEGHLWQYIIPQNVRTPGDCPPPWLHPDQALQGGLSAVVSVGATDINDNIANFSSTGPASWKYISGYNDYTYNPGMGLIRPDVCAPGVAVTSCAHNNNTGYADKSGTSMATPAVAGAMALMLSINPNLTPADICKILETTAVRLPTSSSLKGNIFGSGRIDAYKAVLKTLCYNKEITGMPKISVCDTYTYTCDVDRPDLFTYTWTYSANLTKINQSGNSIVVRPNTSGSAYITVNIY